MPGQNDPPQVVGAFVVVLGLHLGCDLVVGLSDNVFQADLVWIIAKCLKGENLCHLRKAGLPGRVQSTARTHPLLHSIKRKTENRSRVSDISNIGVYSQRASPASGKLNRA